MITTETSNESEVLGEWVSCRKMSWEPRIAILSKSTGDINNFMQLRPVRMNRDSHGSNKKYFQGSGGIFSGQRSLTARRRPLIVLGDPT